MENQGTSLKIFIVDDDQEICRGAFSILDGYHAVHSDIEEEITFTIKCFASAESFLSVLPQEKPDILIIEDKLPGRSGMSVLEELYNKRLHICTIMTASARSTVENAIHTLQLGAYDFMAKPYSLVKLLFHVYKAARFIILTRKARKHSQEKKRARFEIVSLLAHELKSPLNALESYTDIIKNKRSGEQVGDYDAMLSRMLIRIRGMRKLISDLHDLTRVELAQKHRHLKEVDLVNIANGTIEHLIEEADERHISIRIKAEEPVLLKADYDDMEIVFRNLISNAIKYNMPEGSVTVMLKSDTEGVILQVSDSGIGMSPEDQLLIFREFSRVKNGKTINFTGSGLGLPIVKKIVRLYDGSVSVESAIGKGTTVLIRLKAKG